MSLGFQEWSISGGIREKKILEQLSRARFFWLLKYPAVILPHVQQGEKSGNFQNPEKIVFLKNFLIFFFTLRPELVRFYDLGERG